MRILTKKQKMILIFLLQITSIFAKKGNDLNSTLSENPNLLKISYKTKQVNLFVQPRFNTSCDLESLEAANECEARVLIFNDVRILLQSNFSSKSYFFGKPYSKQDLQLIFSECSENCEDQSCVAKCQRDFYINIDCKHYFLKILRNFCRS